jgi:hypothetical protein
MELSEALQVVSALADGRNPVTGQPLSVDHVCQHPQVVRSLCTVVLHLREMARIASPPARGDHEPFDLIPQTRQVPCGYEPAQASLRNAGKPWTAQEETKLVQAFDGGASIGQLSRQHGRTRQAIHGRLYRLGKMPAWRPGMDLTGEQEDCR